ncbi:MAG TPA: hypothetical protein VFF73_11730 [Planctomycetota bacterium]|nr:hypothetical protein [Planctomycetota bacterium]
MRRWQLSSVLVALLAFGLARAGDEEKTVKAKLSPELCEPVRLEADGKPIDTEVGHAAPFVCDWFGDGKKDLLVGQFGGGVLWIYRNTGTNESPKLAAGVKFKDGNKDGTVPTG